MDYTFIIHKGKYSFQKCWMDYQCSTYNIKNPIYIDKTLDFSGIERLKSEGFIKNYKKELKDPSIEDNLEWLNVFLQIYDILSKDNDLNEPRFKNQNVVILSSNLYLYRDFNDKINTIIRSPFSFDMVNLCCDNIFGPYKWHINSNIRIFKSIKTTELEKNINYHAWLLNPFGLSRMLEFWKENVEWFSQYSIFYIIQRYFDRLAVYSIPKYSICYPRT